MLSVHTLRTSNYYGSVHNNYVVLCRWTIYTMSTMRSKKANTQRLYRRDRTRSGWWTMVRSYLHLSPALCPTFMWGQIIFTSFSCSFSHFYVCQIIFTYFSNLAICPTLCGVRSHLHNDTNDDSL